MTTTRHGFLVWVYRNGLGDSTNGGATATADKVVVHHPDLPQQFAPHNNCPGLVLVKGYGDRKWMAVPADQDGNPVDPPGTPWMFGGNYIGTSDSRWTQLVGDPGMVPVHDRTETWNQYYNQV